MPRYYFHHRDGDAFDDKLGMLLEDDDAARRAVLASLPDLTGSFAFAETEDNKKSVVVLVTDEHGAPVFSATLSFAGVWLRPGRC